MYFWNVKKVSDNEYHVIETRFEGEPEYILARCSGPVPAGDIVDAMRVSQSLRLGRDNIRNTLGCIDDGLRKYASAIAAAVSDDSQPHIAQHDMVYPICKSCLEDQGLPVALPCGENNKSSFQFPELEEVHKHVESKTWCGSISDIKFNITNEIYWLLVRNKKR